MAIIDNGHRFGAANLGVKNEMGLPCGHAKSPCCPECLLFYLLYHTGQKFTEPAIVAFYAYWEFKFYGVQNV